MNTLTDFFFSSSDMKMAKENKHCSCEAGMEMNWENQADMHCSLKNLKQF